MAPLVRTAICYSIGTPIGFLITGGQMEAAVAMVTGAWALVLCQWIDAIMSRRAQA